MDSLRKEDLPLAVCLFDVDDLKKINDTYGHDMGDRIIQAFADLLRHKMRADDILCRYGGDEFLVILKHLRDESIAMKKGADLCKNFQEYLVSENFYASCSGGIVLCEADDKPSLKLIERADQALYYAKKEHKGHCCVWNCEAYYENS